MISCGIQWNSYGIINMESIVFHMEWNGFHGTRGIQWIPWNVMDSIPFHVEYNGFHGM